MPCSQCEMLRINGVVTHEHDCPDAWRTEQRECPECGCVFTPDERHQKCCCDECFCGYHNLPCDSDAHDEE